MSNVDTLNEIVNEQEKAVFKSMRTDMSTGKALLNVEQLGYFLREATLDNTILRDADFKLMKSFKKLLNRTGINGRVLTNGYDVNGATDPDIDPADVTFGANELDAKKLKAMCEIEDDEKEDAENHVQNSASAEKDGCSSMISLSALLAVGLLGIGFVRKKQD